MVRAAAKNHPSVAVVVDPARYGDVLAAVAAGGFTLAERQKLAAAAFRHTATYDIAVASWMGNVLAPDDDSGFPAWVGATWDRAEVLRYGENPHQSAALYRSWQPGLAHAEQLHGKAMSYNNYVDTDAAWRAAHDHTDPCVAIIKHANPCGIAVGADIASAHRKAHACDPLSAFGGRDRGQPRGRPDHGRADRRRVHRGRRRAVLHRRRRAGADREEERPAAPAAAPARPRARSCGRSAAACCCRSRTGSTPRATTPRPGRWPPGSRSTPPAWTTWCSPGARCGR